jgi:hypothetical protein
VDDDIQEDLQAGDEWHYETVGEYFDLLSPKLQREQYERAKKYGISEKLGGPKASFSTYASRLHRRRWWNLTPSRLRRFRAKKLTREALIKEMLADRPSAKKARKKSPLPMPLPMKKASSVVFDVRTEKEIHYSLPAREAVIAAYAQFRKKDMNTWDYKRKYGHLAKSIDRSGKWNLPAGYVLEDFVAYDSKEIQRVRDASLTQKLPPGSIRTRAPRVVEAPKRSIGAPERAKAPKKERRVTAKDLMPPAADDVLAGPLSRLQKTVEDVIRGAGRKK